MLTQITQQIPAACISDKDQCGRRLRGLPRCMETATIGRPNRRLRDTSLGLKCLQPFLASAALMICAVASAVAADAPAVSTSTTNRTAQADTSSGLDRAPAWGLPLQKPAWLTDLSVGVRQSYDDNVFLAGADSKYLPPAYTVPPGSAVALRDISSWVTTVSPKVAVNLAPLLGAQNLESLSFSYAPDFAEYYDTPSEDNSAHRFGTAIKARAESFSLAVENNFTCVDGDSIAPTYPGALLSAIGIAAPRERREQIQDHATVALRYDGDSWFIRPTASLLYYDMMTELIDVPGYQDYCDRYDVNGGADFGYKLSPQTAVTLGYRYGYQYQEQFSFSPYSSPSDYQRLLVGFEGKPWKWLEVKFLAGPDFRDYPGDTPTHSTPVADKTPVKYYGEASVTAKLSSKDALTFRSKQFQWVSSLGKVPYYDSLFDLAYRRAVTTRLNVDLGGRVWSADYNSGDLPTCTRDDWQYSVLAGVTYTFSTHLSANLAYELDLGRNGQDDIANPQAREYNRNLVSLNVLLKL
jgi:hypothetical protein